MINGSLRSTREVRAEPIDARFNLADEADIYFTKCSKTFSRNGQQKKLPNLLKLPSNHLEREEQNFERCDPMRGWKLESHPVGVPVTSKLVYTCPCRQANLPGWCIGSRKGVRSSMRDELRTSTCAPRKLVSSLFLLFFFFSPCRVPFPSSNNSTFIRWRVLSAVKLRHVEIMVITGWAQKA